MGLEVHLAMTLFSMAYQQKKYQDMKRKQEAEADKRKGQKFTISGQSAALPVVYGKQALGGINVRHNVSSTYTGAAVTPIKPLRRTSAQVVKAAARMSS